VSPWVHRQRRYVLANARYGRTAFTFGAPVGDFYRVYLTAMAAGAAALVAIAGVFVLVVGSAVVAGMGSDVKVDPEQAGGVFAAAHWCW
jgi:uncharacterized membrane protein YjgN (DUF898 family)